MSDVKDACITKTPTEIADELNEVNTTFIIKESFKEINSVSKQSKIKEINASKDFNLNEIPYAQASMH